MKLDYNLYTLIYLLQLIVPAGIYAISMRRRFPNRIFQYFTEKLDGSKLRKLSAISVSCLILFLPVLVSVFVGNLILFLLKYQNSAVPVGIFLGSTALTAGLYLGFAGICFLSSTVVRPRSKIRRIAVFCLLCFCAAFFLVTVTKNSLDLGFSSQVVEADSGLTGRVHDILSDTVFNQVPVRLVKSPQLNAHAGYEAIYINEGLIAALNPAEFLTIIVHEIKHLHNQDAAFALIPMLFAFAAFASVIFIFTRKNIYYGNVFQEKNLGQNFCVVLFIFLLCVPPAKAAWTQYKKTNEIRADREAVEYLVLKNFSTKDYETALAKTGKHLTEPTALTYLLMFDHPTTQERIANIRDTEMRFNQAGNQF